MSRDYGDEALRRGLPWSIASSQGARAGLPATTRNRLLLLLPQHDKIAILDTAVVERFARLAQQSSIEVENLLCCGDR